MYSNFLSDHWTRVLHMRGFLVTSQTIMYFVVGVILVSRPLLGGGGVPVVLNILQLPDSGLQFRLFQLSTKSINETSSSIFYQ